MSNIDMRLVLQGSEELIAILKQPKYRDVWASILDEAQGDMLERQAEWDAEEKEEAHKQVVENLANRTY